MIISLLSRAADHTVVGVVPLSAAHFIVTEGPKDGPAFVPAVMREPYATDANVTHLTGLVLDCDGWPDVAFDEVVSSLTDSAMRFGYYETHSHYNDGKLHRLPDGRLGWARGDGRYEIKKKSGPVEIVDAPGTLPSVTCGRIIIPFAEPLPVDLWAAAWPVLTKHFTPPGQTVDQSCANPSKLYFLPRRHQGAYLQAEYFPDGTPLDWRALGPFEAAEPRKIIERPDDVPEVPEWALEAAYTDANAYLTSLVEHGKDKGNPILTALGALLLNDWAIPEHQALPLAERLNEVLPRPKTEREEWERPFINGGASASRREFGSKLASAKTQRFAKSLSTRRILRPPPLTSEGFDRDALRLRMEVPPDKWLKKILSRETIQAKRHGGGRIPGASGREGAWRYVAQLIADRIAGETWPIEVLWDLVEGSWAAETDLVEEPRTSRAAIEELIEAACATAAARAEARIIRTSEVQRDTAARLLEIDGDTGEWLAPYVGAKGGVEDRYADAVTRDALLHARAWEHLRYDTFRQDFTDANGDPLNMDRLIADLIDWLSRRALPHSEKAAMRQLCHIAETRAFDSLIDRWDALPAWDGTERLIRLAHDYLHATDETPVEYAQQVVRRWLIAMAARAYSPGCKMDTPLVLQGAQGMRKTSFFELLAGGPEFYLSTHLGAQEQARRMKGKTVVELNEFSHGDRIGVEAIKAWITASADEDRTPYAKAFKTLRRRVVIGGSTNADDTLRDTTGNRRWWVLAVDKIDLDKVREDLPQILAEAKEAFQGGARWWFDDVVDAHLVEQQKSAAEAHAHFGMAQLIRTWVQETLSAMEPGARPTYLRPEWVLANVNTSRAPGVTERLDPQRTLPDILKALRLECGKSVRAVVDGVRVRAYQLPIAWHTAPCIRRGIRVVPKAGEK